MISVSAGEVKVIRGSNSSRPLKTELLSLSSGKIDFDMGFEAVDAEASFTLLQGAQFRLSGAFSVFFSKVEPSNPQSAPLIVIYQGKPEVMFLGSSGSSVMFSIRGQRQSLASLQENQARRIFQLRQGLKEKGSTLTSNSSTNGSSIDNSHQNAASISGSPFAGDLDVYRALERQAPQFERCYRVLIQKQPDFRGVATLSFFLANNGETKDIAVRESFLDESFRRCLEEVVRRTRLPRLPHREPVEVIFPISFE
jgi:hypothetical protein